MEQRTWQLGALPIPIINAFVAEHEYMSNLYPAPTLHSGQLFPSSEHAYAAAKSSDPTVIRAILATDDPAEAKKIGRTATLVEGWEARSFASWNLSSRQSSYKAPIWQIAFVAPEAR
ncbi:NADAR family protein [Rhodococcus erythropolis]